MSIFFELLNLILIFFRSFSLRCYIMIPEIFLFTSIMFLILFFLFVKMPKAVYYCNDLVDLLNLNIRNISVFVLGITLLLYFSLFGSNFSIFLESFYIDDLTILIKIFTIMMSIVVMLISSVYFYVERIFKSFEYSIIMLLSIFSGLVLVSSNDLIMLYATLEMQTLSVYILASSKQNSIFSIEAGLKYFILGTVSSGFFLFGVSLFYGMVGKTNFFSIVDYFFQLIYNDLSYFLKVKNRFLFFIFLFLISFFFKLSAAPFHVWAPDVYEGSPTLITFFFSVVSKIVILGILFRLLYDVFFIFKTEWYSFLFYLCIFSLVIGSFMGIVQKKLKRLMAYSSIANVGFLLIGFLSSGIDGLLVIFLYFLIYFFFNVIFFVYIISLRYFSNFLKLKNIYELAIVFNFRNNFLLSLFFFLNFFSLIGIPPLTGFFGKFFFFYVSYSNNLFWILFFGLLASVISCFFYLRLIRLIFFKKGLFEFKMFGMVFITPLPEVSAVLISISILFNILFFFEIKFIYKIFFFLSLICFTKENFYDDIYIY